MNENPAGDGTGSKRLLGQLGLGALAFGAMSALGSRSAAATASSDDTILNFALNLEYLEAEYYLRAVTGSGLPTSLTGASGTKVLVPSSTLVPFQNSAIAYWAQRIANDELSHVRFLRDALGANAVVEPEINLMTSFTTLAVAAGLISGSQTFNPFENELNFLIGAYIFEDVGVTAYAGAANMLTIPANISYGASILAVEAEHAGCIRAYLAGQGGGSVTNAISALRQKLSGVQDHGTDLSATNGNPFAFANNDYNAQVYRRTPQEVLNVVYGAPGAGVTAGLFFPAGMNGAVTSS
jgi:hypothetical protein